MGHETTSIRMPDGACRTFVFTPTMSSEAKWPAVIFFLDGMGLRPAIFPMAQRIADMGYVVLLPDIFYRAGPYEAVDPIAVFGGGDPMAAIAHIFGTTNARQAAIDSEYFIAYLDTRDDVAGRKIGVTGYCLGGSIAVTAAGLYPDRIAAAGSFHGGYLASDDPQSPHLLATAIKGELLVAGADRDVYYPRDMKLRLDAALDAAGVTYTSEIWDGLIHGWTMADFPVYDREGAERHFAALEALLARTLKA